MEFRILEATPTVVMDDGSLFTVDRRLPDDREQILPPRYRALFRYLVLSAASVRRPDDERVEGDPLSKEVIGSRFLSGEWDVTRAISVIRRAMSLTKGRAPQLSTTLGGGRSHQPTDEAFVRTIVRDTGNAYAFVLEAGDSVDWIECSDELDRASGLLAAGRAHEARALAKNWEHALHSAGSDDLVGTKLWDRVELARLRMLRTLAISSGAEALFGEAVERADEVASGSFAKKQSVYDLELAEAAVRAKFALESTRASGLDAISHFFADQELKLNERVAEFARDLEDETADFDVVREKWFEVWQITRPDDLATPIDLGVARRQLDHLTPLPDVLTPGFSIEAFARDLAAPLDPEIAESIERLAECAVASVENGDFLLQEQVGRDLLSLAEHLPQLEPAGHYFLAEGLRLQADLAGGENRTRLLLGAKSAYETSRDLNPSSVRAHRGLARTYEVLGDPEEASKIFQVGHAVAVQQVAEADRGDPAHRLELSHEVLRVTRHYVHCLSELRRNDQVLFRAHRVSDDDLHALTLESRAYHRERLPLFSAYKRWSRIEWFMGLTLLAKSFAAVGDHLRAGYELGFAFAERRAMLDAAAPLTRVDLANLRWWLATASTVAHEPVPGWFKALDQLGIALAEADEAQVWAAIDGLERTLAAILPPS